MASIWLSRSSNSSRRPLISASISSALRGVIPRASRSARIRSSTVRTSSRASGCSGTTLIVTRTRPGGRFVFPSSSSVPSGFTVPRITRCVAFIDGPSLPKGSDRRQAQLQELLARRHALLVPAATPVILRQHLVEVYHHALGRPRRVRHLEQPLRQR